MERLNDVAQWIILMGFIVSIVIFFLALVVNQSIIVGKTTAESVLDFPKSDIQDLRNEIFRLWEVNPNIGNDFFESIGFLALEKKGTLLSITIDNSRKVFTLHFNNGMTVYDETFYKT